MEEMRGMVQETLFNPLEKPLAKAHYCYSFPPLSIRREAVRREWQWPRLGLARSAGLGMAWHGMA